MHGVTLVVFILALLFGLAPIADAHTDFESSEPADGAVVAEPVSQIQVRFTAESLIAGDGFVVLTPDREIIAPQVLVSDDQREFTLLFDPPLTAGDVGVQWSVRAGDAHPIEGSFSFTTTAPAPVPEPTAEPQTTEPDIETPDRPADVSTEPTPASETVQAIPTAEPPAAETSNTAEELAESSPAAARDNSESAPASETVTLNDFLDSSADGSSLAGPVGFVGRLLSQAGSLIAIGVVAFALWVSSQSRSEMRTFVHLLRQAGVVVVVGAVVEAAGLAMSLGGVVDAAWSSAGFAIFLRVAGSVALVVATTRAGIARGGDVAGKRVLAAAAAGPFSGAIGGSANGLAAGQEQGGGIEAGSGRIEPTAWWFAGLMALSYVFDGHTVTQGNRIVTAVVDLVHVGGAAVWLGGLVCLLVLSRTRFEDGGVFVAAVVKFSVVAAAALAAVGAAGLVLAVTILDSVSEIWSTAWGRLLIAKVLVVGVAVAAGAFNHWVLVPELQSDSEQSDARAPFVRTIKVEAAALGIAVLLTAALVAAAS